jgi:ferrous iron transport protein A
MKPQEPFDGAAACLTDSIAGRRKGSASFLLVIDNQSHYMGAMALRLDQLPFRTPARVAGIDWSCLNEADARRLRNLGFDEGVSIEALHGAPFGRDPLAVRIGRMMVAMRLAQARAVTVTVEP